MTIDQIAESRFQARPASTEIEAALRALLARGFEPPEERYWGSSCIHCGAAQGRIRLQHEPDCPYIAAQTLIARIDGTEG